MASNPTIADGQDSSHRNCQDPTADCNSTMMCDAEVCCTNNSSNVTRNVDHHEEQCQSSDSSSDDICDKNIKEELSLENLPSELLLHICSFLDAKFVIRHFCLVCRTFQHIMSDTLFWKVRIRKRWPKKYPPIPVNDHEFNWKEACIAREEACNLWSNSGSKLKHFRFSEGIYAPVDGVHIMKGGTLLAAGSRDRYLNVFDVTKLDAEVPESAKEARVLTQMNAHEGWIWSITSLDQMLATASWDRYVKFWDMAAGGEEVRNVKLSSAVLCTSYESSLFIAGGYDRFMYHIDPRGPNILHKKRYHKKPVLCLAKDDNYVITGSEDKTIAVYDLRAERICKYIELPNFPMSLSYSGDILWAGDKTGKLHLLDATDGDFNLVETYDVGHRGKVTGVLYTPGALFTSSTDKTIKVLEPSVDPAVITTLKEVVEIAAIDYRCGVLASANSDNSVGVWQPK